MTTALSLQLSTIFQFVSAGYLSVRRIILMKPLQESLSSWWQNPVEILHVLVVQVDPSSQSASDVHFM